MQILRRALFISLLGHLAAFSIFSISFGNRIPKAEFASVSFWGAFLRNSEVIPPIAAMIKAARNPLMPKKPDLSGLDKKNQDSLSLPYHIKPALAIPFGTDKGRFIDKPAVLLSTHIKREPTVVLHPLLPYSFTLYFKDRQVAHVELEYNIVSSAERNFVSLKRKISSGNLEVDLLTSRYISHYLFIQRHNLLPNIWQSVKIDLSAKND